MAALTETLELLITADASKGISTVQGLASSAETSANRIESSFSKVSTSMLKIGAAGIGIGGLLTQLGSSEQEGANQLDAAIKQVGQSTADYQDRINKAVTANQEFGHTSAEVQNALATLTLSYGDTGKALNEMQLVDDLAARKHESLAEAANQVAKAHGGAARLFKEFGVEVGKNADGTKNYDGALTELAVKLQGQASASADTFGGKLKELGATVENTAAQFGQNFGPLILGVSAGLTALSAVASGFGSVWSKVSGFFSSSTAATDANTAAVTENAGAQTASIGALDAKNAALAENAAATEASTAAGDGAAASAGGLTSVLGPLAIGLGVVAVAYEGYTHSMSENIDVQKAAGASTDELIRVYNAAAQSFGGAGLQYDTFNKIADTSLGTVERLRDALKAQGQDTAVLDGIITQHQAATAQQQADQQKIASATQQTNATLQQQAAVYKQIESAADAAFSAALKLAPADVRAQQSGLQVDDAKQRLSDAQAQLQTDEAAGATQQTIAADYRAVAAAQLAVTQAALDQADALLNLKVAQDAANGKVDDAKTQDGLYLGILGQVASEFNGPTRDALAGYILQTTQATNATAALQKQQLSGVGSGIGSIVAPPGGLFAQIPHFAEGGTVPGAMGVPQLAVVHGGEKVLTPTQQQETGPTVIQHIHAPSTDAFEIAQESSYAFASQRYLAASGR